jgi:hypothetical protein
MPIQTSARPIPFFQLKTVGGAFVAREPKIPGSIPVTQTEVIPATGRYNELYCQSGGSNINAGSTNNNTAAYTATNGNWSTVTNQYIPTDGSVPASFITAGDYVSIYIDAATVAVFIARVDVVAGVNGAITVSATYRCGTPPVTSATARSLKAGGAWLGPSGASIFPFTILNSSISDITTRVNVKNDQTYSTTVTVAFSLAAGILQGYSSSPGDGGRATFDFGTTNVGTGISVVGLMCADIIVLSTATIGTSVGIAAGTTSVTVLRCSARGWRGSGLASNTAVSIFIECEAYDCAKANDGLSAGFHFTSNSSCVRCISSYNSGSLSDGFNWVSGATGNCTADNCIAFRNGRHGFSFPSGGAIIGPNFHNCDSYFNGGSGLANNGIASNAFSIIENCNFIGNNAWGIASTSPGIWYGMIKNCGFGTGSMRNASGMIGIGSNHAMIISGNVQYPADVTPWTDPINGDFRIDLDEAIGVGIGSYKQSLGSLSGTIGYPDIGAAQALVTAVDEGTGGVGGT